MFKVLIKIQKIFKHKIHAFISTTMISAIVLMMLTTGYFYSSFATNLMIEHENRANRDLTQQIERGIWPKFRTFVEESKGMVRQQLLERSEIQQLDLIIRRQMTKTNILKAKIYNLDGLTIYSSQPKQIGKDKSDNIGFQNARNGEVTSYLAYRAEFHAFEKIIVDRDIISSYIPLINVNSNKPVGVIEVYSDVTELVSNISRSRSSIIFFGFLGFAFMYIIIQLVSRRVAKIVDKYEKLHRESAELANIDELTSMSNRKAFKNDLKQILTSNRETDLGHGLIYIDLDGFKLINDSYGHNAGDEALRHISLRIQDSIRRVDKAYRIGGDEFTVILQDINNKNDAINVAAKMIENIAKPMDCNGIECLLTASVGIVLQSDNLKDAEEMIEVADKAMYEAKRTGANKYHLAEHIESL